MIAGTNTDCKILKTEIQDSTAVITLLLFANKVTYPAQSFQIYLQDKGESKLDYQLINDNVYWVDYRVSFLNDNNNVDINKYKEVKIYINIANSNNSKTKDCRWVRECYIHIINTADINRVPAWSSGLLQLVSAEFEIPFIKSFNTYTELIGLGEGSQKIYRLHTDVQLDYESDVDYNYNNKNFKYEYNIKSITTGQIIETINQEEDLLPNKFHITSSDAYYINKPIDLELLIRTLDNKVVTSYKTQFIPVTKLSNTYVKTKNGIKRAVSFHVKMNVEEDEHESEWLGDKNNG